MKFRKIWSFLKRCVPFALCLVVLLLCMILPRGRKVQAEETQKRIVSVWNVDTFEGGKGSRTSFLKKIARSVEKERDGVYYLVTSYTPEGAAEALSEGILPDALSFGVGLSAYAEISLPLPYAFAGGDTGGDCLAYPWCRGEYALFSLTDNFSEAGQTVLSVGGSNLTGVAAAMAGISGQEKESLAAYTDFLAGKYRYLLGTQRDECRFLARGTTVYKQTLPEYCDLYQYFSVLSTEKRDDCLALLSKLLSSEVQSTLDAIGMYPVAGATGRTVSVFASDQALDDLRVLARTGERKNIENYLKTI